LQERIILDPLRSRRCPSKYYRHQLPIKPRKTNMSSNPPVCSLKTSINRTGHITAIGAEASIALFPCRYCAFLRLSKVLFVRALNLQEADVPPLHAERVVVAAHAAEYQACNRCHHQMAITLMPYPIGPRKANGAVPLSERRG